DPKSLIYRPGQRWPAMLPTLRPRTYGVHLSCLNNMFELLCRLPSNVIMHINNLASHAGKLSRKHIRRISLLSLQFLKELFGCGIFIVFGHILSPFPSLLADLPTLFQVNILASFPNTITHTRASADVDMCPLVKDFDQF